MHHVRQREAMRKTKALLDQQVEEIKARREMESQDLSPTELQLNSSLLKKVEADPTIRARLQVRTLSSSPLNVPSDIYNAMACCSPAFASQEKMSPPRYVDPLGASRRPI